MSEITISSKFQIVIPKEIREQLKLKPGHKLQAMCIGKSIQLVPVVDIEHAKGFLKGIETDFDRDPDRL